MADRFPCRRIDMRFFETATIRFTNSIEINATPQRIFDIFEDGESWPVWAPVIRKVTWTSPKPFGVGTTRSVDTQGDITGYEEFIAWEHGKRMAFRFNESSKPGMDAFGEDYIVETTANGCRVTWTVAMSPTGISRVVMPVFKPVMKLVFGKFLKNLKKYAEKN
jgi:hypothetical protein